MDNPLSLNRYTYVSNNPLRYIDPSGHQNAEVGGGGGVPAAAPVIRSWNELLYIITAGVVSGTKVVADTQTQNNDKDRYITLYHGTKNATFADDMLKNGIDLNKARSDTDFGIGFYVTKLQQQAQEWAGIGGKVLVFRVKESELRAFSGLIFPKADSTWSEFIRHNRTGGKLHSFDYVEGSMLMNVNGFLYDGERAKSSGHQISIHTQRMIDWLEKGMQKHTLIGIQRRKN